MYLRLRICKRDISKKEWSSIACILHAVKSSLRKLLIWYSLFSFLLVILAMLLSSTTNSSTIASVGEEGGKEGHLGEGSG